MKLALSTGSLHTLPLAKACEIARETGFDGVEVIINQDFQRCNQIALIRELQSIVPVLSLHSPFFDLDGWGDKAEQVQLTIRLALETGVRLINFHPPSWLGFELRFWRWFKGIRDYQAELGRGEVIVTMENMPSTGPMGTNPYVLADTERMVEFLHRHNLFLTFDTAHIGSGKTNFINDFHRCYDSGRMRNIHFSDYGNGREHLLPGHGVLPLTRFLNHLRETAYNETITLELSPYEFPKEEVAIRASMKAIYDYLASETGRVAGGV